MSFRKITLAVVAASVALSVAAPAFAGPFNGPEGFAQPIKPTHPGPGPGFGGPGGFANPQGGGGGGGGGGGKGGFNPAYGIMLGVGAIAAGAMAAEALDDDEMECWKEKRKGKIVLVCAEY